MRIGIETSALSKNFTGTGRYINCLLEQLKSTGNELITFSPTEQIVSKGFVNEFISRKKNSIQRHLYRQFNLAGEMQKANIEFGIFPNYFLPQNFNRVSAIVIHDLSFITHPQFYSKPFVYYYNKQMKETLKQKPVIITVSENSKEQIHKHLGIRKDDIFLIQGYSNFNKGKINPDNLPVRRPYLLYVGHVEPRKNLAFLIENFLSWKSEKKLDLSLIIAGELWIKSSSISSLLNKYKNHPDITFTGYVEEVVLQNLYSNAAGFIHTSFAEGFGFPVLEAMHYGLPIICSQGTATEEISSPGSIVINPQNNISLKKGLNCLYENYLLKEKTDYHIKYSPARMNYQLSNVLDIIEMKVNSHIYSYQKRTTSIEEAVEKTLLYASIFNSGIKRKNLFKTLFDIKANENRLDSILNRMINEGIVLSRDNTLYLNINKFKFYNKVGKNKHLTKSILFLKLLKIFPLISVISFSGGTAHYGLNNHNDVDLFIITKPNCLYPVYAVIHILSYIFGLRKVICANYLIDENNLDINSPRDFYTAHQIMSLVPYKNKPGFDKFLFKNSWVNYFFPNFEIKIPDKTTTSKLFSVFIPVNFAIMSFYKRFYRTKISGDKTESLKITTGNLKLHTNDHRLKIISTFENEWKLYCKNKQNNNFRPLYTDLAPIKESADSGLKTKVKVPA